MTSLVAFQVSKIGLKAFLAQLVSILKAKSYKVVMRGKMMFFNIGARFFKMYTFEVVKLFLA